MKTNALKLLCLSASLLAPVSLKLNANEAFRSRDAARHLSDLTVSVTLSNGSVRTGRLEGVGCSGSICSRIGIKAKDENGALTPSWLDGLAAIKDTTADSAVFVMKDGSEQRRSFISDFRVLYLLNQSGMPYKLDLAKVKRIDFPVSSR
jgi:hypothetical protein